MNTPYQYWVKGFSAANNGLPEDACPLLFAAWPRDAWLAGHRFQVEYRHVNVRDDKEPLERINKTPFDQGKVAAIKGIAFGDCPYDQGTDQTAWQAGWISQQDKSDPLAPARGIYNAFKYTLWLAIAIGLLWAFINVTWPTTSGEQSDCQRNSPPWHTAECAPR